MKKYSIIGFVHLCSCVIFNLSHLLAYTILQADALFVLLIILIMNLPNNPATYLLSICSTSMCHSTVFENWAEIGCGTVGREQEVVMDMTCRIQAPFLEVAQIWVDPLWLLHPYLGYREKRSRRTIYLLELSSFSMPFREGKKIRNWGCTPVNNFKLFIKFVTCLFFLKTNGNPRRLTTFKTTVKYSKN